MFTRTCVTAPDDRAGRSLRSSVAISSALLGLLVLGLALGASAAQARRSNRHAGSRRAAHVSHCTGRPKVLRVGTFNGKHGQCASIQEAVDAVAPGGWILIGPGDYKQSSSRTITGAFGDDRAGAAVLITTPGIHLRGMNRNTVVIDGTKPGSPKCSAAEADQNFGPAEGGSYLGNNGVVVYKADGVSLQNFTTCNFLGDNAGGDSIWFDGGGATGHQAIGSWLGEYLSATSTYWAGTENPSDKYGIYASNTTGPGIFDHTYANNMSDSGYYIGACPDCNAVIDHSHSEGNDLGYSGSNSGGHVVIRNSEFNNNQEGVATQSQNNDDAPPPQDGICPEGTSNPTPPAGAQRSDICWVMINNRVVNNNNGATPVSSSAPGLLGTGMSIAGGRNDLVVGNTFSGNGAWGVLLVPYPGIEETPPPQVPAEDNCKGGIATEAAGKYECLFEASANEVTGNTFSHNGAFGNPSNGDIGEVANANPSAKINCWHGNVEEGGGEPTSEPKAIQATHGTCSAPDIGGEPLTSVLGAQATCDSQLVVECPGAPGANYPRSSTVTLLPEPEEPTMPNPCEGVPRNPWCARHK
jgi:hypothetical protein